MNVSTATAAAMLAAVATRLNGGTLVFYSGAMPTTPQTALVAGNTALVTFTYNNPSFGAATYVAPNEVANASLVSMSSNPSANGTAVFARAFGSDGTAHLDLTVGTTGTDIIVGSTTISIGVPVTISSYVHRIPAAG